MSDDLKDIEDQLTIQRVARRFKYRNVAKHSFALMGIVLGLLVLLVDESVAADYFRYLALAMGAYILVFSARIVQVNYQISKKVKGSGAAALLPIHIQAIALSYMVFVVGAHARVVYNFGEPAPWYGVPTTLVADAIGVFALGVIWRFQTEKRGALNREKSR